jgi:hypothetical protein
MYCHTLFFFLNGYEINLNNYYFNDYYYSIYFNFCAYLLKKIFYCLFLLRNASTNYSIDNENKI